MEKKQYIIEQTLISSELEIEDGGCAKIFTAVQNETDDYGIFVRICSWDESKQHSELEGFINRKVRITIETID